MIPIPFSNGNTYQLKNRWEELTTDEYINVLDLITLLCADEISIRMFRVRLFLMLTGLKMRLSPDPETADRQAENIYRISQQLNFPLRIEYTNTKTFANLKPAIREKLGRYLPEELEQVPEVRWAAKTTKKIIPDLAFPCNLVPVIGRRRHKLQGYTFELTDGILTTSLSTSQFIDAQTVAAEIQKTGSHSLLNLLVAILYTDGFYRSSYSVKLAKSLDWIPLRTKKAIFINFNAIQEYLYTRTKYRILFNEATTDTSPDANQPKHNLGLSSVVHSLIKSGYGDIENSNLVKFFEIMYSDLVSTVTSLHKQGKKVDEISQLTGLTITKINHIL